MRITTEIVADNKPIWALSLLAHFPFERNGSYEYPDEKLSEIKGAVLTYIKNFEFVKRNARRKVGALYIVREEERVITVSTLQADKIMLTVIFSDDEPQKGTCAVCGCTETNACYNPYYGNCWWIGRRHILCSHCAITEIVNCTATEHAERKINWRTKGCK